MVGVTSRLWLEVARWTCISSCCPEPGRDRAMEGSARPISVPWRRLALLADDRQARAKAGVQAPHQPPHDRRGAEAAGRGHHQKPPASRARFTVGQISRSAAVAAALGNQRPGLDLGWPRSGIVDAEGGARFRPRSNLSSQSALRAAPARRWRAVSVAEAFGSPRSFRRCTGRRRGFCRHRAYRVPPVRSKTAAGRPRCDQRPLLAGL